MIPRLKNYLVTLNILLSGNIPYRVPPRVQNNDGWDMVWVMLQRMGSELHFISMESCCLDTDSGLVLFVR